MQLTQQQCLGLDEVMLESGMTPSSILSGSREVSKKAREASRSIEILSVNPMGASFHPLKKFPHVFDLVTGTGRKMPTRPFDHKD
jgi:hypothetical protein